MNLSIYINNIIKLNGLLNRLEYFLCLALLIIIYLLVYNTLPSRITEAGSIDRLFIKSFFEFIFSVFLFVISAARLRHLGRSVYWGLILFFSWGLSLRNMILADYYFNNSNGITPFITYIGSLVTVIAYIFVLFLLGAKNKKRV